MACFAREFPQEKSGDDQIYAICYPLMTNIYIYDLHVCIFLSLSVLGPPGEKIENTQNLQSFDYNLFDCLPI